MKETGLKAYLEKLISKKISNNGVFSVKLMWYQKESFIKRAREAYKLDASLSEKNVLERIFGRCYFIYIEREDKLEWAISLYKARNSLEWRSFTNYIPYNFPKPNYSFRGIQDELKFSQSYRWQTFFEENGIKPLILKYEQLSTEYPAKVLSDVFSFSDVEFHDGNLNIENWVIPQKQRSQANPWKGRFIRDLELESNFDSSTYNRQLTDIEFNLSSKFLKSLYSCNKGNLLQIELTILNHSNHTFIHRGSSGTRYQPYLVFQWFTINEELIFSQWIELESSLDPGLEKLNPTLKTPNLDGYFLLKIDIVRKDDRTLSNTLGSDDTVLVHLSDPVKDASRFFNYPINSIKTEIDWFGKVDISKFPWINHSELEWLYCSGANPNCNTFWFWMPDIGLLYTHPDLYPNFNIPGRNLEVVYQGINNNQKVFSANDGTELTAPTTGLLIPHKRVY